MADTQSTPPQPDLIKILGGMARACDLREDFLIQLLLEPNDWSFVVKIHALLESIVCSLLASHLDKPNLEAVFAENVPMRARIGMLKKLGLTDKRERKMIRALGELRNQLVHNARQTDFTFAAYFTDTQRSATFGETFGMEWPDPIPGTNPPVSRNDYVVAYPKPAVWVSVMGIMVKTVSEKARSAFETQRTLAMTSLLLAGR